MMVLDRVACLVETARDRPAHDAFHDSYAAFAAVWRFCGPCALGKSISSARPLNLAVTREGSISIGRSRERKLGLGFALQASVAGFASAAESSSLQMVRRLGSM